MSTVMLLSNFDDRYFRRFR